MSDPTTPELSKEDTALLIRSFWEALLVPSWKKDDLITLGKLVFAKVPLREIDPETFRQLLPHIKTIANALGKKLMQAPPPTTVPTLAPAPSPAAPEPKVNDGQ